MPEVACTVKSMRLGIAIAFVAANNAVLTLLIQMRMKDCRVTAGKAGSL